MTKYMLYKKNNVYWYEKYIKKVYANWREA